MIPIASEIQCMNIVYLRQITGEIQYQLLQSMQKNRYVYYDVSNSFLDTNTFTKYPATLLTGPFKPSYGYPNF